MKQRKLIYFLVVLSCTLGICACKKVRREAPTPIQEKLSYYTPETGYYQAFAADDAGYVYTIEEELSGEKPVLLLKKYEQEKELSLVELKSNMGRINALAGMDVKDDILYLTVKFLDETSGNSGRQLVAYSLRENRFLFRKELNGMETVYRLLATKDFVYLLGTDQTGGGLHPFDSNYRYKNQGEKIVIYSLERDDFTELEISQPMDISLTDEGELAILSYLSEETVILLYDAQKKAAKTIFREKGLSFVNFALCGEDGIIYTPLEDRQLYWASLTDSSKKCVVYYQGFFSRDIVCKKGKALVPAEQDKLVSFQVEAIRKDNKEIRFISCENQMLTEYQPYSCGYQIRKTSLEPDKMALKMLAADSDFDLCYFSSSFGNSKEIKENGSFYALDQLAGINEYLDACFPYVSECAKDETGSIWMLPVSVDIGCLACDTSINEELTVPFSDAMTYEEFLYAVSNLPEEYQSKIYYDLRTSFLFDYFASYNSIDTREFRSMVQLLKENKNELERARYFISPFYNRGEYLLYNLDTSYNYRSYKVGFGEVGRVISFPKIKKKTPNYGTCTFFVVNPKSDNLEAVLSYLEEYIAYAMNGEKKPLFFRTGKPEEDSYDGSLYKLYENGKIVFSIDAQLKQGFDQVLDGTKDMEEYIRETEPKLRMYFGE